MVPGLRVQGVRSELGIPELMQIRGYIETIFGTLDARAARLPLVAATLNNALGGALTTMAGRASPDPTTAAPAPAAGRARLFNVIVICSVLPFGLPVPIAGAFRAKIRSRGAGRKPRALRQRLTHIKATRGREC